MILEKDKIYKVRHGDILFRPRDYIIFSPISDIKVLDGFFGHDRLNLPNLNELPITKIRDIATHFTICFDGSILTKFGYRPSLTGLDCYCELLPLTQKDLTEIRETLKALGHGYLYNRKLNKLMYEENVTQER